VCPAAGRRENISAGARIFRKNRVTWFACTPLWLAALPALAQELRLSPASGAPGQTVSVRVELVSPAGNEPAALEWEIRTPQGQLTAEVERAAAEKGAVRARKTLRCAVHEGNTVLCVISGGREKIANGPVARLVFKIPANAMAGEAQVRVVRGTAVTGDSQRTNIPPAESWVKIRLK
jgi:hypothetical protein